MCTLQYVLLLSLTLPTLSLAPLISSLTAVTHAGSRSTCVLLMFQVFKNISEGVIQFCRAD